MPNKPFGLLECASIPIATGKRRVEEMALVVE